MGIGGITRRSQGAALALLLAATTAVAVGAASPALATTETSLHQIVPAPVEVTPRPGMAYTLTANARIQTQPGSAEARKVGEYAASLLRPATGYRLPVSSGGSQLPGGT